MNSMMKLPSKRVMSIKKRSTKRRKNVIRKTRNRRRENIVMMKMTMNWQS
jgi:hypothetical protein